MLPELKFKLQALAEISNIKLILLQLIYKNNEILNGQDKKYKLYPIAKKYAYYVLFLNTRRKNIENATEIVTWRTNK